MGAELKQTHVSFHIALEWSRIGFRRPSVDFEDLDRHPPSPREVDADTPKPVQICNHGTLGVLYLIEWEFVSVG